MTKGKITLIQKDPKRNLHSKNEKATLNPDTNSKNTLLEYWNGLRY